MEKVITAEFTTDELLYLMYACASTMNDMENDKLSKGAKEEAEKFRVLGEKVSAIIGSNK